VRGGVGAGIGEGRVAVCGREVSEALYLKQALWKGEWARSPELRSMSTRECRRKGWYPSFN